MEGEAMSIYHQIVSLAFVVGVIGNLTASAVLGIPALIQIHKKLDRHHAEHLAAIERSDNALRR